MRLHNQKFDMIIRGIVMTRGENGATIEEMRSDYFKMFNEPWLLKYETTERIVSYLLEIRGLMMENRECGLCIWYIDDIGSNMTGRQMDSNNNIDVIDQPNDSGEVRNDSDAFVDPQMCRQMITSSSFVSGNTVPSLSSSTSSASTVKAVTTVSSASLETINTTEPIENECQAVTTKRKLSHGSCSHVEKRVKSIETDRLPLIEKNLNLHNWNSGATGAAKLTTSTEKENSISIPNGVANVIGECIEEIGVVSDSEYRAPIKETELKKIQKAFPERCQVNDKSNALQTESVSSTDSRAYELIPPDYAIVGDDFMRSLISFELYGGDFTDRPDKRFSYCISGLTVRQAYYMILDKQSVFTANYRNIIVNVGAIDILLERNLIDIEAEYARLIHAITTIGCHAILTTIPDLKVCPNNPNKKIIRQMVLLFNRFVGDLHENGFPVIDFHSYLSDCDYHPRPKITHTEKTLQIRLWGATGRKKIVDALEQYF